MENEEIEDQANLFSLLIENHLKFNPDHPSDKCAICDLFCINPKSITEQKGKMSYKFVMLDFKNK